MNTFLTVQPILRLSEYASYLQDSHEQHHPPHQKRACCLGHPPPPNKYPDRQDSISLPFHNDHHLASRPTIGNGSVSGFLSILPGQWRQGAVIRFRFSPCIIITIFDRRASPKVHIGPQYTQTQIDTLHRNDNIHLTCRASELVNRHDRDDSATKIMGGHNPVVNSDYRLVRRSPQQSLLRGILRKDRSL